MKVKKPICSKCGPIHRTSCSRCSVGEESKRPKAEWSYLYRYNSRLNAVVVFESYTELYGNEKILPYNVFSSFTKAKKYGIGICKAESNRAKIEWEECNSKYKNLFDTKTATQSWDMETPTFKRFHSTGRFIASIGRKCIIETFSDPRHICKVPKETGITCKDCSGILDETIRVYLPRGNGVTKDILVCSSCLTKNYEERRTNSQECKCNEKCTKTPSTKVPEVKCANRFYYASETYTVDSCVWNCASCKLKENYEMFRTFQEAKTYGLKTITDEISSLFSTIELVLSSGYTNSSLLATVDTVDLLIYKHLDLSDLMYIPVVNKYKGE